MKNCPQCSSSSCSCWCHDVGAFILRFGIAFAFVPAGLMKLLAIDQTIGFFSQTAFPWPISLFPIAFLAYFVGLVEFLGGLAFLFGIYQKYAGMLLAVIMVVAVYVLIPAGPQMYAYPLTLVFVSLGAGFINSGKISLSARFGGSKTCNSNK